MTADRQSHTELPESVRIEGAGRELDAISAFVAASGRLLARLRELPDGPEVRAVADGLYEVSRKLLTANENLAGWRYRFLRFNFRGDDAVGRFLALVEEYYTRRTGEDFHELKYRCGDISVIYERNVEKALGDVLGDVDLRAEVQTALDELGASDGGMVRYIYDTVLGEIETFVRTAEPFVDDNDLNGAEGARLAFKARSAEQSVRLEKLGNELSDLVVHYAALARRPVELD